MLRLTRCTNESLATKFPRRVVGAILLCAFSTITLTLNAPSFAQTRAFGPPELLRTPGVTDVTAARVPNRGAQAHVMRSRYVRANIEHLFDGRGNPRDRAAVPEITLNLFPDAVFKGVVTDVEPNGLGWSWVGALDGVPNGYFFVVVVDGTLAAHVASPKGIYEVAWAGDGLYEVIQIDQSAFVDHDPNAVPAAPATTLIPDSPLGDTAATIDIMVVYTPAARLAEGSTAAMKARIALAVTETRDSYVNSSITPRLRLVHVEELAYTESGNLETDKNRLVSTTDSYLTGVHALRNAYGADLVSLIVDNGGGFCGLAAAILANAATAFQVTARNCATGYYSFGHEFGHLQGARHDLYVDSTLTPYAYGHGYVNAGSTTANRWRTIMAYPNRCSDNGFSCIRLKYWSNPNKTYNSAAMGVAGSSENYRVLNNTAYTVANFRQAMIGPNFNSTFNVTSTGWSAVYGVWGIYGSAYYRTTGVANMFSSARSLGKYGDLQYEARMRRSGVCTTCINAIVIRGNTAALGTRKEWIPSYAFAYNNAGNFSVLRVGSTGATTILKGWTASAAIVKGGWNNLKVVAVGSSLKFYVNGTLVWSGTDSNYRTGYVGVTMYRDSYAGTLDVDYATLTTSPTS